MPQYDPNKSTYIKVVDALAFLIFSVFALAGFATTASFLIKPLAPVEFLNYFPEPVNLVLLKILNLQILLNLPVSHLVFGLLVTIIFYFGTIFIPFISLEFILNRPNSHYKCIPEFRHSSNLLMEYRASQIWLKLINQIIGKFLLPGQALSTFMFVYGSFYLIKHSDTLARTPFLLLVVWASIGGLFWCCALLLGGYLHFHGTKTLNSWKRFAWMPRSERIYMKRVTCSCQPFSIQYGNLFVIKNKSLLLHFRRCSKNLMRALLAANK